MSVKFGVSSLSPATLFEFSHSIARVNGKAAQTIASEKIITRLMAVFQIKRKLASALAEGVISGRWIAPAAITAAGEISGVCWGTLLRMVPMVMLCPTAIETALDRN